MTDLLYKDEAFRIIGLCMEVHRNLGRGFDEVVSKDALQYEFAQAGIAFERERRFDIKYKRIVL
ncbi:MAG: GxxExxY protein [Verrucomicrobia bacterium]|nr:GxxExxY protein [Verrucomicrobiota bacterium]